MSDIAADDLEDIYECDSQLRKWINQQSRDGKSVGVIAGALITHGVNLLYVHLKNREDFYPLMLALIRDGMSLADFVEENLKDTVDE